MEWNKLINREVFIQRYSSPRSDIASSLEARECAFVLVPVPAGSLGGRKGKVKQVRQAAKSKIESEAVRAGRAGKNRTDLELHQHDDSEIDIDLLPVAAGNEKFERAGGGGGGARGARAKVKPDT